MTRIEPGIPDMEDIFKGENDPYAAGPAVTLKDDYQLPKEPYHVSPTMFPPASPEASLLMPKITVVPPLPNISTPVPVIINGTRNKLERNGTGPNLLPENAVICSTRVDNLLRKPLPATLPPVIFKRWNEHLFHPKDFPTLRRAMAVGGITFIGDIPDMDEQQLYRTLKNYGFDDDILDLIDDFLLMVHRQLGITFRTRLTDNEQQHFQRVKNLSMEQSDPADLKTLLMPIDEVLKKFRNVKIRKIMEIKLGEIGCTLVGDFVELDRSDLENCGLAHNPAIEAMTAIIIEEILDLGLKMGMRFSTETKKALQRHKADQSY